MRALLPLAVVGPLALAACDGAAGSGAQSPQEPEIAHVHRARCGSCHERVEPGERTPAVFRAALARHHDRVHLSDGQWAAMLDYLSTPRPSGG